METETREAERVTESGNGTNRTIQQEKQKSKAHEKNQTN